MTARGIHSCCPEAPTTINVTQNIVELDGYETLWRDEYYTGAQVVADQLTLSYAPYAQASVQVILNSGTQRQGTDYTIIGNVITFTFTPAATDVIHVRYVTVGAGTVALNDGAFPVGTTIGYNGASAPTGWFMLDGDQVVTKAGHPVLYAFLELNLDLVAAVVPQDPADHTLSLLPITYYDPATTSMVYGNTIIKHDG
jgi:hypothetical protein